MQDASITDVSIHMWNKIILTSSAVLCVFKNWVLKGTKQFFYCDLVH